MLGLLVLKPIVTQKDYFMKGKQVETYFKCQE